MKVRAARRRRALTQEALAALIGLTPESISNIERGVQTPSLETLYALAQALELSVTDLLDARQPGAGKSQTRLRLEAQLTEQLRNLDDRAYALLLEQATALSRYLGVPDKG